MLILGGLHGGGVRVCVCMCVCVAVLLLRCAWLLQAEAQVAAGWTASANQHAGTDFNTRNSSSAASFAYQLPFSVLKEGTDGFSKASELGGGGSCLVYKGKVFGVTVAIKALTAATSSNSALRKEEEEEEELQFVAEMALLQTVSLSANRGMVTLIPLLF